MKTKLMTLIALLALPLMVQAADVVLEWDANPTEQLVTHYTVYERTPVSVKLFTTTNTVATVTNVSAGVHTYVVTASNAHGESAPSNPATATMPALVSAPLNLRATIKATVTITVQ